VDWHPILQTGLGQSLGLLHWKLQIGSAHFVMQSDMHFVSHMGGPQTVRHLGQLPDVQDLGQMILHSGFWHSVLQPLAATEPDRGLQNVLQTGAAHIGWQVCSQTGLLQVHVHEGWHARGFSWAVIGRVDGLGTMCSSPQWQSRSTHSICLGSTVYNFDAQSHSGVIGVTEFFARRIPVTKVASTLPTMRQRAMVFAEPTTGSAPGPQPRQRSAAGA